MAIKGKHLPTEVGYDVELQSGQDPDEYDKQADVTVCANPQFYQLSGCLVSDDSTGEETGCGGSELPLLYEVCGCEAGWTYCQIL